MLFGSEKRRSAELRSCALDALSAGIMIIDAELNIVFVNETLTTLLRDAEADIKAELRRSRPWASSERASTVFMRVRRTCARSSVASPYRTVRR